MDALYFARGRTEVSFMIFASATSMPAIIKAERAFPRDVYGRVIE